MKGARGKKEIPELLVDTGATFTVLPPEILSDIGASSVPHKARLELGDGRFVDAEVYVVSIWVHDREGPTFAVAFKGAKPVLGVRSLEDLGLKVDPVSGTLEPTRPAGVAFYYTIYLVLSADSKSPKIIMHCDLDTFCSSSLRLLRLRDARHVIITVIDVEEGLWPAA